MIKLCLKVEEEQKLNQHQQEKAVLVVENKKMFMHKELLELFYQNIDFQQKLNGNMLLLLILDKENIINTKVKKNILGLVAIQEQEKEKLKEIN